MDNWDKLWNHGFIEIIMWIRYKKKKTFNEVFVFNYGEVFILGLLI